jgi:hypothetical protein
MAVSMKIAVFWVVAPCSLVENFEGNIIFEHSSPCLLGSYFIEASKIDSAECISVDVYSGHFRKAEPKFL